MKALVVYESIFGNTRRIAEAIGQGLGERADVELREVGAAPPRPEGFDLIVVGGPTHAWGLSRASTRKGAIAQAGEKGIEPVSRGIGIREWLEALPRGEGAVAAFDTAVKTTWFPTGSAARRVAARLHSLGYRSVTPPEQFLVSDTTGPLLEGEIERARAWGQGVGADMAREIPEPAAAG